MLNKITIALSAALVLGAVSTASAEFDPWIITTDMYLAQQGGGYDAFASAGGHEAFASVGGRLDAGRFNDPRYDASAW